MSIQPYALCPCGSGKQFKWCCQPYYPLFIKALEQQETGQKATARMTIDQLTSKFAQVPQAWCYRADFLARTEDRTGAEQAVEQALKLDPELPFANFMKGMFRFDEGETTGAILLFRRAAERFPAEAKPMITEVNSRIAQLELQENRPVASIAAMRKSLAAMPDDVELRTNYNAIFGSESQLLSTIRREYQFRPGTTEAERTALAEPIKTATSGRWTEAAKALEAILPQFQESSAVQFNHGLLRAWLGDNRKGIDSLVKSAELTDSLSEEEEAVALAEVLRGGRGLENISDHTEHRFYLRVLDGPAFSKLFSSWANGDRLIVMDSNEENETLSAIVLEKPSLLNVDVGPKFGRMQAFLVLDRDLVRVWHASREKAEQLVQEIRTAVGKGVSEPQYELGGANFGDLMADLTVFPLQEGTPVELVKSKREEAAKSFFEDVWLKRSLHALGGGTPLDASTHPTLKRRLPGIIKHMELCFFAGSEPTEETRQLSPYDFNRLRKKLGLLVSEPDGALDFDTIDVAKLGTLEIGGLAPAQLTTAFQAAIRLDSPDLAGKFAKAAIGQTEIADRYPFFQHLISLARQEGDTTRTMELLKTASEADSASNEGKRGMQYRILTGQAIARSGQTDEAYEFFKKTVADNPNELSIYAPAAETMLSKNLGAKAMEFINAGLTVARNRNDRGAEQHFLELTEAAKKRGG
ncbi:SEC-C domain-containing protein [Zavarzinella formosa]|uniref:SEC-C domain-containing protein n=1 Tax=Zavarzinella formosa TaxID=360055 RepID=UPI0002E81F0B|nr:SEC-C domain-containing protein [Zavarzinella formosa]